MADKLMELFLSLTPEEQNAVLLWIEHYEHTTDYQEQPDILSQRTSQNAE